MNLCEFWSTELGEGKFPDSIEFKKMPTCHAMQCILSKIILEKIFICKVDSTCNSKLAKFYSYKSMVYKPTPFGGISPMRFRKHSKITQDNLI
jgi:hypothetical protein